MSITKKALATLMLIFFAFSALAQNANFTIADIRLDGLQRVGATQVFSAMSLNIGDKLNSALIAENIEKIFATGFFNDVQMFRQDNILIVKLDERPVIESISIDGNKKIPTEQLEMGLENAGLSKGNIFTPSSLGLMQKELVQAYNMQGRYSASVEAKVKQLDKNRVVIDLKVNEGTVASIKRINIVGNHAFSNEVLLDELELKEDYSWNLFSNKHEYSKERLMGDLERIQSWYFNHGYIKAKIIDSDVSISSNRQDIYISITLEEGEPYTVSKMELAGDLIVGEKKLFSGVVLEKGEVFSRQLLVESNQNMAKMLGDKGYTYAEVREQLIPNDEDKSVAIVFNINPGRRYYVRRINITGNVSTKDEVLRRQLGQIEGTSASTQKIQEAKNTLMRLGFFKRVDISTTKVAGVDDQIDVNLDVEEQSSGSIALNLGYSVSQGLMIGGKLQQNNFLGTGNSFSIDGSLSIDLSSKKNYEKLENKSRISKASLYLSYFEPYYTIDGVSRGVSAYYNYTNFDFLYRNGSSDFSKFSTNSGGVSLKFGYPVDSLNYLSYTLGFDYTYMHMGKFNGEYNFVETDEFAKAHGVSFPAYKFDISWSRNTLNKGILPTDGSMQNLSLTLNGTFKYNWFKLNYKYVQFWEFADNWSLQFKAKLGYGRGYTKNDTLPLFSNFYSGGIGSVRGYSTGSLGPDITKLSGKFKGQKVNDTLGGNILIESSLALIFPMPFVKDHSMIQPSVFFDVGSVFNEKTFIEKSSWENIGYSVGVSVSWITPMAPITFSLSYPIGHFINSKAGKKSGIGDREIFQFTMGTIL